VSPGIAGNLAELVETGWRGGRRRGARARGEAVRGKRDQKIVPSPESEPPPAIGIPVPGGRNKFLRAIDGACRQKVWVADASIEAVSLRS